MKELKRTIYFISLPLSFIGFIFPIYASSIGASPIQIGYLYIKLIVEDNGIGSKKLVKGNGLLGIENRANDYKGQVKFSSNNGFKIELSLPI
ncbi:MAG: hypothetical protein GX021_09965 [Tissierellia bacterium]|nr:hypothetical protein [Tissierellia bacterium]